MNGLEEAPTARALIGVSRNFGRVESDTYHLYYSAGQCHLATSKPGERKSMLTLESEWPSAEMNNCDGDCALAAFCRRPRVSVAVDHIAYRDPAAVSLAVL